MKSTRGNNTTQWTSYFGADPNPIFGHLVAGPPSVRLIVAINVEHGKVIACLE
jgi:hypothetical protein